MTGGGGKRESRSSMSETVSAALLVAGTAVGAGILALPSATMASGFIPSSIMLLAAYMTTAISGMLIAEATEHASRATGKRGLGLTAVVDAAVGKGLAGITSALFGLVCYTITVAYCAQGGALLEARGIPGIVLIPVLTIFLTLSSPRVVDTINNALVSIVVISFACISFIGGHRVQFIRLARTDWRHAPRALPICAISLVYHTVVPFIVDKLDASPQRVKTAIFGGSAVPLIMFLCWNAVILGAVSAGSVVGDPVAWLRDSVKDSLLLGPCVWLFSLFAVITSFIGIFLGLRSFLADSLGFNPDDAIQSLPHKTGLALGAVLPPLIMASLCQDIFIKALDLAGIFVSILFGIIPAYVVWNQRYRHTPPIHRRRRQRSWGRRPIRTLPPGPNLIKLPGGKPVLLAQIFASLYIITDGLYRQVIIPVRNGAL